MIRVFLPVLFCVVSACVVRAEPWPRHAIDDSSRGADGVRLADVNGDGYLDIATGWEEGGVIRVYLNPGPTLATRAWPAVTVGRVRSPEDAVFVDLDEDGAVDVVSCCEGKNRSIYVHWAPVDPDRYLDEDAWRTGPVPAAQGKQMWMFAMPLQVDGRQGVDLVVGSKSGNASVSWLQSPARPRQLDQWELHPLAKAGWIMSLKALDMDGDGDLDVLASDRKGSHRGIRWFSSPGTRSVLDGGKWKETRIDGGDREVMFLATGSFAATGEQHVWCAVRGAGISHLWRNGDALGAWQFQEIPMPPKCGSGKGIAYGDMNGDGREDLVFSCENSQGGLSGVRWLARDRVDPNQWRDHEISGSEGTKFDRLELLDLDGDGDLDVLTCEERSNLGVIWYENPGTDSRGPTPGDRLQGRVTDSRHL